jgi:threonine dehydrogenase-like Zn-dependent dehydrogenase
MDEAKYSRQVLLFGEEGQRRLASSRVGIVGLGGLGSQVLQALAYLGVGHVVLIDDDRVSVSNLNRLVGASPADAEHGTLKVDVAARTFRSVQPEATATDLPVNLRTIEAMQALEKCPVVFGCVDGDGARLVLSELTAAYSLTLIDCAAEIFPEEQPVRWGGRVVVATAGQFCLDCARQIDMDIAKEELATPGVREARRRHGYGAGDDAPAPAVVNLNGVIANLGVTEFMVMTTALRAARRFLVYHADRGIVNERQDERRPDCYTCGYLAGKREAAAMDRYVLR